MMKNKVKVLKEINNVCYYAFLICMPFLIPEWLNLNHVYPKMLGLSFFFIVIGMLINVIIFISEKNWDVMFDPTTKKIFYIYFYVIISQLLVSLLLYRKLGELYGFNTHMVFLKSFLIYTYIFVVVIYNKIMLSNVNMKSVIKLLWILTIVGCGVILLQTSLLCFSGFRHVYDLINFAKLLPSSSFILSMHRICGFGYEPSYYAIFHIIVSIPIICVSLKNTKDKGMVILNSIMLCIIVVGAYLTKSSTIYISLAVVFLILLLYLFKTAKIRKSILLIVIAGACLLVVLIPPLMKNVYLLVYKIFDLSNWSVSYRYSTIYNDIKCFLEYPLFGVGDGNQGFFYNDNMYGTIFDEVQAGEVIDAINGRYGLLSGGAMIPSIISGFGLVGVCVFGYIVYCAIKKMKKTEYYMMYLIGLITFLVCGTVSYSQFYNYIFAFIIILPWCINTFNPKFENFKKVKVVVKGNQYGAEKHNICY